MENYVIIGSRLLEHIVAGSKEKIIYKTKPINSIKIFFFTFVHYLLGVLKQSCLILQNFLNFTLKCRFKVTKGETLAHF